MSEFLYGKNPILEAFRAHKREIKKFYYSMDKEEAALREALDFCRSRAVPALRVEKSWLEKKVPGALTQGWGAEVSAYPYQAFEQILNPLQDKTEATVLALDQIQDPQNVGALLRSAECCGVDGVLIPELRSSPITAAVCKAAAGAEEYLAISRVTNLARAIEEFKQHGFWVVGTALPAPERDASPPSQNVLSFDWPSKTVLILGGEGKGMRRLTEASCDFLIHLPLAGKISSLNVSATGAVCLYERIRKRGI